MLGELTIWIVSTTVTFIGTIIGIIASFVMPLQIHNAVTYFFSYLPVFNGIFPVVDLMQALGTVLAFGACWYALHIAIWFLKLIPFVGKYIHHPHEAIRETTTFTGTTTQPARFSRSVTKFTSHY